MIKYLSILFLFISFSVKCQELNANVVINHQQVRSSDDYIYDNMKKSFTEFLNNRKWTGDKYKLEERIECSFFITISSRSGNSFSGSIQVQSGRPVFGVNYKTTMFIVNDNDFDFVYVDQQALDFNQNEFIIVFPLHCLLHLSRRNSQTYIYLNVCWERKEEKTPLFFIS